GASSGASVLSPIDVLVVGPVDSGGSTELGPTEPDPRGVGQSWGAITRAGAGATNMGRIDERRWWPQPVLDSTTRARARNDSPRHGRRAIEASGCRTMTLLQFRFQGLLLTAISGWPSREASGMPDDLAPPQMTHLPKPGFRLKSTRRLVEGREFREKSPFFL